MTLPQCIVMVPGSSANVGSGFDVFGIAVSIYSYFSLQEAPKITYIGDGLVSEDIESNIVYISFARILKEFKSEVPKIGIWVKNHIPLRRGLGSSSSAIVGGLLLGYVYLKGKGLLPKDLENIEIAKQKVILPLAMEIEGHPDNVTPTIFGGFTISNPWANVFEKLNFPESIGLVFVIPNFEVSTSDARKVLPKSYSKEDVVFNLSSSSTLLMGIIKNDKNLISYGLRDKLHQPYRLNLYKGFGNLLSLSSRDISDNFIGSFISGSGPTICFMFYSKPTYEEINKIREYISRYNNIDYDLQILSVDNLGARLI
ncbi:MAG: homoserine kinase [Brevinematia bacterium]